MKDLNMTTARRTGCQSKEKLTTTAAVAEKRRSTRRPGATQDWRWARSKMIRGRHQDDPARNRPRGTSTNESPHAGANNEKLSTRDISNELLQVGDEPHAGANNEKLSTRDITKNELLHAGANNEKLSTRSTYERVPQAGATSNNAKLSMRDTYERAAPRGS